MRLESAVSAPRVAETRGHRCIVLRILAGLDVLHPGGDPLADAGAALRRFQPSHGGQSADHHRRAVRRVQALDPRPGRSRGPGPARPRLRRPCPSRRIGRGGSGDGGVRARATRWWPSPTSAATAPASGWSATAPPWSATWTRFRQGRRWCCRNTFEEPNEAGIFYIRHPDEPRGRITSITIKKPPVVVGDGRSHVARPDHGGRARAPRAASVSGAPGRTGWIAFRDRARTCGWCSSATTARGRSSGTAERW